MFLVLGVPCQLFVKRREYRQPAFLLTPTFAVCAPLRVALPPHPCVRVTRVFFFSWQIGLEGAPDVLLDPNTLSEDGTSALTGVDFSKDGKKLAYGISKKGSDW